MVIAGVMTVCRCCVTKDFGWFVGLFEGEGTIQILKKPKEYSVYLAIQMTDEDVVRAIIPVVGGSVIGPKGPYGESRKPTWIWKLHAKPKVKEVLEMALPLLGERRAERAREAISYIEAHPRPVDKEYCVNGHRRAENLVPRKNGQRYCRKCQQLYDARRRNK